MCDANASEPNWLFNFSPKTIHTSMISSVHQILKGFSTRWTRCNLPIRSPTPWSKTPSSPSGGHYGSFPWYTTNKLPFYSSNFASLPSSGQYSSPLWEANNKLWIFLTSSFLGASLQLFSSKTCSSNIHGKFAFKSESTYWHVLVRCGNPGNPEETHTSTNPSSGSQ